LASVFSIGVPVNPTNDAFVDQVVLATVSLVRDYNDIPPQ
jgi:hypothetical protein